jgi:secreted PhoX family phosphatase
MGFSTSPLSRILTTVKISRRSLLCGGAAVTAGFLGLRAALGPPGPGMSKRYGRLRREPLGYLHLPEGFSCVAISATGEEMSDGLRVPGGHDGMAAVPGPGGRTILVRNHELERHQAAVGPFGARAERLDRVLPERIYDRGPGGAVHQGGTTTLVYDTRARRLERHFLSLAGTSRNCAGGPTPWGSWLSCEEDVRNGRAPGRDHGYVFEVPATDAIGLAEPVPLKAMGRFNHEAAAVEPGSGDILLTEDRPNGLLYRFTPASPGELRKGGRLRALAFRERTARVPLGRPLEVEWIDLDRVDAPGDTLRRRGAAAGAATFARGEGIWAGADGIYFCATTGGADGSGQIWRHRPGPPETLELFCEPGDPRLLKNGDNLTVSPWGDLFVCEDGPGWQRIVAVTPSGELYTFAENILNGYELAGGCFSPDGTTFFFNLQVPGVTLAITGPWKTS